MELPRELASCEGLRVGVDGATGCAYMLWAHAGVMLGVHWSTLRAVARMAIVRCSLLAQTPSALRPPDALGAALASELAVGTPETWPDELEPLVPSARDPREWAVSPIPFPLLACAIRTVRVLHGNITERMRRSA